MVVSSRVRELSAEDRQCLDKVFERFRTEFAMWTEACPTLWQLLAFVQYEGAKLKIVDEAEPLIKGQNQLSFTVRGGVCWPSG